MTNIIQFVDSLASSPTVRLDLNDTSRASGWMVSVSGSDFSPPPMRRTVVSTMLRDGEPITAGAYSNRTVTLALTYVGTATANAAALALSALAFELNRPSNILKVQFGTVPVFFRTYRAPDYSLTMLRLMLQNNSLTLEIPAQPFGSGIKETVSGSPFTVNFNPAAGSNGMFFDVTGVKGDVETPLRLTMPGADLDGRTQVIAVRRRGTPSATPFLLQAESMSRPDVDASLPGNDALMSGAGSNYVRHAFTTTGPWQARLDMTTFPASASVDARGTYRVFVRVRKSSAASVVKLQVTCGDPGGVALSATDAATLPLNTTLQLVDLGLITIGGAAPVLDGDGTELSVAGARILVYGERTSGSGSLDVDYLLFVPADDRLAVIKSVLNGVTPNRFRIDSDQERVFAINAAGAVETIAAVSVAGGLPMVSPGVTNRVYFLEDVTAAVSDTAALTAEYWPRYLLVPGS
jgi:hypothetical protein